MSEYIRFAKLPILLLIIFMIARLILGATGVPYESGTIVSMVFVSWIVGLLFRRLRATSPRLRLETGHDAGPDYCC